MTIINKALFILAYEAGEIRYHPTYKKSMKNQFRHYDKLKGDQEKQLKAMIDFCYENVPYYRNLFDGLKLLPKDIRKIEDLEKLPILTKDIMKQNWEDFKPVNLNTLRYHDRATGGSTGTPFKFRLSKFDRFLGHANLHRGWGYGEYELGDKMVFLAGSSLGVGTKSNFIKTINEVTRNIKLLSSFDMGEMEMKQSVNIINSFKPKFLRGYASSIYFFAKWIEEKNIEIYSTHAVFTTAEKLLPEMREKIESVFNCDVYDAYGLNDGGVAAYECSEHQGLHIDTERSVMEIVNEKGGQLENGKGKILATSLYNYSMPFVRYDTGDLGYIVEDICSCGRGNRVLKEVVGRQQEILETPEGKHIHGEFFTHLFWEIEKVKEFQVVQEKIDEIVIKMVPEIGFDKRQLNKIREIIRKRSEGWNVEFKFVDKIDRTKAGKYKFIISNL